MERRPSTRRRSPVSGYAQAGATGFLMSSIISLAAVGTQLSAISDGPDNVVRLSIRKQNNFDIFVSYFPEDQKYWDEARKFLTYARRSKARIYSFDDVRPGRNLPAEAQAALFSSVIAILLISQDYVDSPLMESEFPHLLERAKNEGTLILTLHVGTFDTYG